MRLGVVHRPRAEGADVKAESKGVDLTARAGIAEVQWFALRKQVSTRHPSELPDPRYKLAMLPFWNVLRHCSYLQEEYN